MNQVQKISFQFSGEEEHFFTRLYAEWDVRWIPLLEKSVDRILKKHNDASLVLEIDTVPLDLGYISEPDFERKFLPLFEEHLENQLLKKLYDPSGSGKTIRKLPVEDSLSELLF